MRIDSCNYVLRLGALVYFSLSTSYVNAETPSSTSNWFHDKLGVTLQVPDAKDIKLPDFKLPDFSLPGYDNIQQYLMSQFDVLVKDIAKVTPIVEEMGFSVKRLSFDLKIPPKANLRIIALTDVPQETIETLANRPNEDLFVQMILNAVKAAHKLQSTHGSAFKNPVIDVKLGIPPRVRIMFLAPGERLTTPFDQDRFIMNEQGDE